MQAIPSVILSWCHSMVLVFSITFGSGKAVVAVCNVHGLIFYALSDLLDRCQNYKEFYNLRHSQVQNMVERIFGVAKKHFAILQKTNEYPMPTQVKVVSACGVMHNFICTYDPAEVLGPCEPEAVDTSPAENIRKPGT